MSKFTIQSQLAKDRANLEIFEAFAAKYPAAPGFVHLFCVELNIDLRHSAPERRDQVLAQLGEMFGRHGWMKRPNNYGTEFNWWRVIDGVKVIIDGAETLAPMSGDMPVPPSAFPILLEDAQAEEEIATPTQAVS